jgi:DNA-binding LacI/PurR family transcriptional regulator
MALGENVTPAPRRPTIRDVAAEAGVSKSVASRVYSGSTHVSDESRARVEAAAERLGFRPNWVARSLAGEREDFVGILVADLHNPVFAEVVDAARAELSRHGQVGLLTTALLPRAFEDEDDSGGGRPGPGLDDHALALFGDLRPSRLLLVGSVPNPERILGSSPNARVVAASSVPVGLSGAQIVRGDDGAGMRLVVDHLGARGHVDIAHVGGAAGPVSALRAAAYRDRMREHGLGEHIRIEPSDYTQAGGLRAGRALIDAERPPSAIAAVNDLAAIGVLVAVSEAVARGAAPVAVTGYDDTFLAELPQIALTSVDPGNQRIGREAARLLLGDAHGPREVLVPPSLVERTSSGSRV